MPVLVDSGFRRGTDIVRAPHAGVLVPAGDRSRLERVCRYALRPPVAHERIGLTDEGQVRLALRHRWDGTTHLVFDPIELLERLAALTPRPRLNLILYDGVLGAHAAWRSRLRRAVGGRRLRGGRRRVGHWPRTGFRQGASPRPHTNLLWAQLMQRSFGFDAGVPAARAVRGGVGCVGPPALRGDASD